MGGSIVCLAAVLLGVDARWPPLSDGGFQYVIQIEPQVLERLESGAIPTVGSYVPPYVQDVRAYQIAIGTQRLPKHAPTPDVRSPILTGADTDWVSLPAGGVECRVWIRPDVLDELQKPGGVIEGKIPAHVKKLSLFTIAVGTKPLAVSLPATNGGNLSGPVEAKVNRVPAELSQSPSETTPPALLSEPGAGSRPMPGQLTNHSEPLKPLPEERPQEKPDSSAPAEKDEKELSTGAPDKLSLSPIVMLLGLVASLAGNIFLLWIMRDFRNRYRALLRRMEKVGDITKNCALELESSG